MTIKEVQPDSKVMEILISFSEDWEKEASCHGYRKNSAEDIKGNRVFLAVDDCDGEERVLGYLFGYIEKAERTNSIHKEGTVCFEIEEIYVRPEYRSKGIGSELFRFAENAVKEQAEMITLSTATKNFRAILHFYIDEVGMEFWNARLFKRLK